MTCAGPCLRNNNPKCEPQLGKRGLYGSLGGGKDTARSQMALLWVLNLSDGQHSLLDVAERSGLPFELLVDAADALLDAGLLAAATDRSRQALVEGWR